ncbi:hypothetical protein V6N12_000049 [Hibiscus sabdariffa]|uniref:Uncharacterized protein n=1 Tax=Hibiscus sabdariffa TaxID=183260 RepID=A0ABR2AEF6_9ROSI
MATETPKKPGPPKIVTLNNASKLAEQWINKMNGSKHDEVAEVEPEARPERLGLGAKVPRQSKVELSNDPVARKLSAKLGAGKRKASKNQDSTTPSSRDLVDKDNGDEDLDSRSSAFSRKRTVPLTSQLQEKTEYMQDSFEKLHYHGSCVYLCPLGEMPFCGPFITAGH